MKLILYIGVVTCVVSTPGVAQMPPRPPLTAAECETAAQSLGQGSLETSRWSRIAECGQTGATALASAFTAAHTQTNTKFLGTLLLIANLVRDPGVWQASLALATDRSGSIGARMVGMLVAVSQRDAGTTLNMGSWTEALTVPMGSACRVTRSREGSDWVWVSSPGTQAGYVETTAAALSSISVDVSEPAVVRDLASCLRSVWSDVVQVINPAQITVSYVCGTKYRVGNASPYRVVVEFQLFHGPERGAISVPASGEAFIITHNPYGFTLSHQGQALGEAQNGGTTCPP